MKKITKSTTEEEPLEQEETHEEDEKNLPVENEQKIKISAVVPENLQKSEHQEEWEKIEEEKNVEDFKLEAELHLASKESEISFMWRLDKLKEIGMLFLLKGGLPQKNLPYIKMLNLVNMNMEIPNLKSVFKNFQ